MTIELWDIDVPYEVQTEVNDDGKDIIVIKPNSAQNDRIDDYNICLDVDGCRELARVLRFMAREIE